MVHDVRELATCIPTDNEAGRRARETRVIFSELTSVPALSFSTEGEGERERKRDCRTTISRWSDVFRVLHGR